MTRINTIDPALLTTPWLLAEYRELPRVINKVAERGFTLNPAKLPPSYVMGAGHVTFFYPRVQYLFDRHTAILKELQQRFPGSVYAIDTSVAAEQVRIWKPDFYKAWQPSPVDHVVCLARLKERWKGTQVEWFQFLVAVVERHPLPRVEATPLFMELLPCL